ncbi:MAG TPA: nucleotidyltransferase domain-containing protein [Pyrinomonadaceae bacterium]|nr:nucleotidyltransferase domain-containing protein [Pyrinomonadaceae bacterium]
MLQRRVIARLREVCRGDERVVGALMYGSFATGEADAFSDIEFAVLIRDEAFDGFGQRAWLDSASPVAAYFPDDFGHHTALFENGVRGEFHFMRASEVAVVESWRGSGWFPSLDAAVVLDRTGELSRYAAALVGGPPARGGAALVEGLCLNLLNLMLFGANLLSRGEFARAWALLSKAHENLLKLVRLSEGATDHWPTPSRALEHDLSAAAYERYLTCAAGARPGELCAAYRESWRWGRELFETVGGPLKVGLPATVTARVGELLDEASARSNGRG